MLILAGTTPSARAQGAERTGSAYRGLMEGGIWLELADNERGQVELAILDGLPGGTPQTRFIGLSQTSSTRGCELANAEGTVKVFPCRPGGGPMEVTIGDATGAVAFQEVSWAGSFAWGGAAASVAEARARCLMTGMHSIAALKSTSLGYSLASMQSAVQALPMETSDLAASIEDLRVGRLAAYATLALTPAEAEAATRLDAAILGRTADGKSVSLSDATAMRQAFDREVTQSPRRKKARDELLTVDRQLSEIYNPVEGVRQTMLRSRIRNELLPAVQDDLIKVLTEQQPLTVEDLLALEIASGDVEACARAVSMPDSVAVRQIVQAAIGYRADDVGSYILGSVSAAEDSTSARQVLAQFENNPGLKAALASAGKQSIFSTARTAIARMAADEEKARLAGIREAARVAAQDAIPPTTGLGRFQPKLVGRSVVYIFNSKGNGRGSRGSGFVVAPGIVVTNVHVIEGYKAVYVTPDGKSSRLREDSFPAEIIAQYPIHDIAILRVKNLPGRVLAIAGKEPDRGAEVWALGYPAAADSGVTEENEIASFTRGHVSRVVRGYTLQSERLGETRLIQHDAQISGGNSGGAILDVCHRVVGINTQVDQKNGIMEAVSADILPELLRQAGVKPTVSGARCG